MEKLSQVLVFVSLFAPLVSFLGICFPGKRLTRSVAALSIACLAAASLSAIIVAIRSWNIGGLIEIDWFVLGNISFDADIYVSNQSLLMLVVVALISLMVHIYSTVYMKGDRDWKRYFAMLGFFTFSMQGIVLSDNLLFLFIFWELVGFSSYLLIGHWTDKPEAGSAASKAFVLNRIGDAGFLIGLMIIWTTHETFSLSAILPSAANHAWQTAGALCIFCGIIGKSAQFPLFTWLPDAMEGPTPVSALIHAATMVAAGVYLLVRVFALFTEDALVVVAAVGMITAIIGALAALSQYDIKKILAYSTMSQLGLMILALGMGAVDAALLHLLTHAFFKACLFLAAGIIIHSLHEAQSSGSHFDAQDVRNMGGLKKHLPMTFLAFTVSAASLAGVPFFSGFLSKEAMLTAIFVHTNAVSWLIFAVILSVSFLTVLYSFRLIWFVFFGETRTPQLHITEPAWAMRAPVLILATCSLWFIVSPNPFDASGWILNSEPTQHSMWITVFSSLWVIAALWLGWYIFRNVPLGTNAFFRNAFYVDTFYSLASSSIQRINSATIERIDKQIIDGAIHASAYAQVIFAHVVGWIDRTFVDGSVNAIARLTGLGGKFIRSFQGGNIQLYIFWSVFAIIIFIIWAVK